MTATVIKLHTRIREKREQIEQARATSNEGHRDPREIAAPLPPRPEGFTGKFTGFGRRLPPGCPKNMPSSAVTVASVEWSGDRHDVYKLSTNKARSVWILWIGGYDDMYSKWVNYPYAYGPRWKVGNRVAAIYLLIDGWRAEHKRDSDPGPFSGIVNDGLINPRELKAIRDLVWEAK